MRKDIAETKIARVEIAEELDKLEETEAIAVERDSVCRVGNYENVKDLISAYLPKIKKQIVRIENETALIKRYAIINIKMSSDYSIIDTVEKTYHIAEMTKSYVSEYIDNLGSLDVSRYSYIEKELQSLTATLLARAKALKKVSGNIRLQNENLKNILRAIGSPKAPRETHGRTSCL